MKRLFEPEIIRAQIANLNADRERIEQAIQALESALRNIEGLDAHQKEFNLNPDSAGITLQDAVKKSCLELVDGITRQRVITWIERQFPLVKPNPSSVSAALINLSKGENPMLQVGIKGQGSSPALYSTQGEVKIRLNAEEIADLMDETAIRGVGGWQSLWTALQKAFDKSTGQISLTATLRARLYHYYHAYGVGGWQTRVKRVFRRELPHLFTD